MENSAEFIYDMSIASIYMIFTIGPYVAKNGNSVECRKMSRLRLVEGQVDCYHDILLRFGSLEFYSLFLWRYHILWLSRFSSQLQFFAAV